MDNKLIFKRKTFLFFFASLLIGFSAFLIHAYYDDIVTEEKLTRKIQARILDKEKEVENLITAAIDKTKERKSIPDFEFFSDCFGNLNQSNVMIAVYRSDSLVFWSDNSIQVDQYYDPDRFDKKATVLSNGWIDIREKVDGDLTFLCFIRIKNTYPYENDYLSNTFASYINVSEEIKVLSEPLAYNIYNLEGDFLISLDYSAHATIPAYVENLLAIAFILSYILLLVALHYGYKLMGCFFRKNYLLLLGYAFDVVLIRFLLLYFNIPSFIDHAELFAPQYFATSFLAPSLGDLFLNLASIFAIAYAFFHTIHLNALRSISSATGKFVLVTIFLLSIFLGYAWLVNGLQGIVANSSFSFNLADITSINFFSISGFLCFSLYLFIFVLFSFKPALFLFQDSKKNWKAIILLALYLLVFTAFSVYVFDFDPVNYLFLALYFAVVAYIAYSSQKNVLFASTVLLIVLFAIFSTFSLNTSIREKEKSNRAILAQDLMIQKDPILEYKFQVASTLIQSDTSLISQLKEFPFTDISEYDNTIDAIYQTYFSAFSARSDVWLTLCDPFWVLDIQNDSLYENCFDYFYGAIDNFGDTTDYKNLYFMDNSMNEDNYLGVVNLPVPGKSLVLFVEIFNKYISSAIGFSELLVDKEKETGMNLSVYSYCRYEKGEQINQVGAFFYPLNLSEFNIPDTGYYFFDQEGYNHMLYSLDNKNTILISRKNPGFIDLIAPFSYISIFLGLLVFLFFILFRGPGSIKFTPIGFKKQMQLSITAIIIVSFLFVGIGSLFYITTLNHNKNISILQEKSNSVLIELNHKLNKSGGRLNDEEGILTGNLIKFSLVFFTDINLYDIDGQLLATSAKGVFRKGLSSRTMNSSAYLNMHSYGKSLFIHQEKIGEYSYLSAYRPLRDNESKVIAYLNLPYFAKQDELTNEISTFLVAFINVYVILIAFSIYLALVISNYITKPIELIREKIGKLKLGNTEEKIEWKRQDEIGSLIAEYNRMVDELAQSAELLAKSERESAWREMAKQIAHEIKNPLTPMKLSVQYLQKAWDEKAPDWDNRLQRFTNTIIEQINSLSIIASEFSDFAKMPRSNFREIDLVAIIQNAIGIYSGSSPVQFEFEFNGKHMVIADKEQLLRVFNNLIKNSIQAIQDPDKGLIRIVLSSDTATHHIMFSDNGKGIPEEMKEKVFYPNFTTKSGGMGLGLAMSKSIIENAKGSIRFESEESVGTTFFISLPRAD